MYPETYMRRALLAAVVWAFALRAAVPTPTEHLGYTPGDDYKLADYNDIISYFQKLEKASPRVKLSAFGKSSNGKTMYVAFLSSEENLQQLEKYREIARRLALGRATPEEARRLAAEGKAIVWIDSGLHATEVAPVQHAPELAYRMVTGEDEETRRIRQNVILMQVPVINPDGLDIVAHWYRKNVGTPYELAPLTELYQKYADHDNNRDYFMLNLEETRHVTRLLFAEWFPHIVYNQHQRPAFPARIFVPPYAEPLNPNIPAPVMEGINLIGSAMKERFARENKPGVLSYYGFDGWWNGGLRSVPAFHNMHGILTETAGHVYATPKTYKPGDFPERFGNGIPTREPSIFYQRPWMGGKWGVREAIDYMLTADFAILDLAAARPAHFLMKAWELARANVEAGLRGKPYAYIVPGQADHYSAVEMLRRLSMAGVQVKQARAPFQANGKSYPAGTFVLPAAQPFRPYLVDLMEQQRYPELKAGTTGPTKRPYDVAGWTLHMLMGVEVHRVDDPFEAQLGGDADLRPAEPALDHRDNSSFLATADLLKNGARVRWAADGAILVEGRSPAPEFAKAAWELAEPRLALYLPYSVNMDAGWTQWVLDNFRVPYRTVRKEEFQQGGLRERYDTVMFAAQSAASILHGVRAGQRTGRTGTGDNTVIQRPEYTGGIGVQGLAELESFVRNGGTLLAVDTAAELPVQHFPLPVSPRLGAPPAEGQPSSGTYYCPGSLIRIQVDTAHPVGFGMPKEAIAFSNGGQAWDISLLPEYNKGEREVRGVARYASTNLLASGWISGERAVLGKHILLDARHGKGRVILYGFRPQFRGQTFGTFKLLLNAIYWGSAKAL